jgi:hypothetical protein
MLANVGAQPQTARANAHAVGLRLNEVVRSSDVMLDLAPQNPSVV